jgi:hypothetical protein
MSATATTFDLDSFARAVEQRDAATQLSMYGPDATVTIIDKITQPGSPRVLQTREQIQDWLEDLFGREMTHSIQHRVKDDTGAAFTMACRYPDGTNVACATVIRVAEDQIRDQIVLQAWDEK